MSVDFFVAVLWFHFSTWLSLFFIDSFFGCVLMHSCMYSIVAFGVFFAFLVFWTSSFSLILRRSSDVMTPDVVPVLFVLMVFVGLAYFKCLSLCGFDSCCSSLCEAFVCRGIGCVWRDSLAWLGLILITILALSLFFCVDFILVFAFLLGDLYL